MEVAVRPPRAGPKPRLPTGKGNAKLPPPRVAQPTTDTAQLHPTVVARKEEIRDMSDESLGARHEAATAPSVPPRRVRNASAMDTDLSAVQPQRQKRGNKGPSAATEEQDGEDTGAGLGLQDLSGTSASQPKWNPFAQRAANAEDGSDSGASGLCSGHGYLDTEHQARAQVTPASVRSAAVSRSSPRLHTDAAVKRVLESMGDAAEVAVVAGASDSAEEAAGEGGAAEVADEAGASDAAEEAAGEGGAAEVADEAGASDAAEEAAGEEGKAMSRKETLNPTHPCLNMTHMTSQMSRS